MSVSTVSSCTGSNSNGGGLMSEGSMIPGSVWYPVDTTSFRSASLRRLPLAITTTTAMVMMQTVRGVQKKITNTPIALPMIIPTLIIVFPSPPLEVELVLLIPPPSPV